MISVSEEYRTELANDNRNFYCEAVITCWNGETITATNDKIWEGGFRTKQAVSGQSAFEIGACVIGELKLVLNNIYGDFDGYDLNGAQIVANIGLYDVNGDLIDIDGEGGTTFQKGVYFVDEIETGGSLITLTCLDAMVKFDRNFSEVPLAFPATLQQIVTAVCNRCGVPYSQVSFPNSTYSVSTRPSDDQMTCRDVLGMVCEIACCYGTIDRLGNLTIDFFNTDFMETIAPVGGDLDGGSFWVDVDSADGGSFWNFTTTHDSGTFVQQTAPDYDLSGFFKFDHDANDVRITGAKLTQNGITYLSGSDRYTVSIQNNLLINSGDEVAVIADIASKLIGCGMRPFSAEHLADPTIEAGDAVTLTDHLGNTYRSVITQTEFSVGDRQRTDCDAESYVSNQSIRYTSVSKEVADYNVRAQAASGLLANAYGLYRTEAVDPQVGGITPAVHNAETLEASTFAMIDNENGLQVGTRTNASADWTWTAADAAEGAGLKEVLDVVGINADWIRVGTIDAIDITSSAITGGSVTGTTINNGSGTFVVDSSGNVTANSLTSSNATITGGEITLTTQNILSGIHLRSSNTNDNKLDIGGYIITKETSLGSWKWIGMTLQSLDTSNNTKISFTGDTGVIYNTGNIVAKGVYSNTSTTGSWLRILSDGTIVRDGSSSKRYKHDITQELDENPDKLYELPVVQFKYNDDYISKDDQRKGKDIIGFIAEEVAEVMPSAVDYNDEGRPEMWNVQIIVPAMLKLIQEQKKQIDALEERVKALEERSR